MTDFTLTTRQAAGLPIGGFVRDVAEGSRLLAFCVMLFALGFVICTALPLIDERLLLGVSVWEKPAKFFLSLGIHFATVSWALSLLDGKLREVRGIRRAVRLMTGAAVLELIYIVVQAARGVASHFNTSTTLEAVLYPIMGVGALTLTATAGFIGYKIWRNRNGNLWREATGVGLMLGAVLGTLTAGYMSSMTGHAVGGAAGDATGLPFFHWSTTGGDLRVAHFVGLHAMQVLPLAAMSGRRGVVYGVAGVVTVLTALTFVQAVMGVPLLRG
jgi:hypothetical protein